MSAVPRLLLAIGLLALRGSKGGTPEEAASIRAPDGDTPEEIASIRVQGVLRALEVAGAEGGVTQARREKKIFEEYVCEGSNKMKDAIHLTCNGNCGSDCCCQQICLPKGVWKIAQKHGVTKGDCNEMGWDHFEWQSVRSGVHYNVRAPPRPRRCARRASSHECIALVPCSRERPRARPGLFQPKQRVSR